MADRVIFVCIIILAAVYLYATEQLPSLEIGDPLGPKAFPRLLGIALLVTAGVLLLEIWREGKPKREVETKPAASRDHFLMIAAVVVWTALYFALFETLGYVISSAVYLLVLMAYFNRGKWVANVSTSVLVAAGSYGMFNYLLGVTLPRGLLPF